MNHEPNAGSDLAYDAEQDLQQRLSLATPEHTTRGFLFMATLKLVREFGQSEEIVQRCQAATGEKSFSEFFNYPTSALLRMLNAAAQALSGKFGSYGEALRQIGYKAGEIYMETPVGKSARQKFTGDPQQLMSTLQALYWVLTNYGQPLVSWTGPKSGTIAIQRTFMPLAYHEGGGSAMARKLGMHHVRVRARSTGPLSIELEFSW
jgi:uncharacterized protein (TIGR02265 family)